MLDKRTASEVRGRGYKHPQAIYNFPRNLAPDLTHYISERPEMSSQDESSRKAKPTRKKNKMEQKKAKKTIKVRDLKPTKDVKGGYLNTRIR